MKSAQTPSLGMPLAGDILPVLVACVLTPGQDRLLLSSSGLNFGLRRSAWHLLGLLWGGYLTICLAAVGLGALFIAVPGLQILLRVAAGFCMLWLGYRLWHAPAPQAAPTVRALRPLRFGEAVLLQLGNTRSWLVAAALIVGFVPAGERYLEQMLATALVFCLATAPGLVLWTTHGAALQARMRTPSQLRRLQRGMAMITAAAAWLFWL